MSETPIRTDIQKPLDIHHDFGAEHTLDLVIFLDDMAEFVHLVFGEVLDTGIIGYPGLFTDSSRG